MKRPNDEITTLLMSNLDPEILHKEIRCSENSQHRIEAAKTLISILDDSERIAYLVNVVLYDPDPEVKGEIKGLLLDQFGKELVSILQVEGIDGEPMTSPWMVPCSSAKTSIKPQSLQQSITPPENWSGDESIEGLQDALRDPLDVENRLYAAKLLVKERGQENLEMLAKAVLYDPDENVQQQAYQSLYEAAGSEKADALLDEIGSQSMEAEEEWLLIPDLYDQYENDLEEEEGISPFGINKSDQVRGMVNLFTNEHDPEKRITILSALAKFHDVNVNESIARVGLFDIDEKVREAAKAELQNRLGDHLDEFLEHVYSTTSTDLPDADEVDEEEDFEVSEPVQPQNDYSQRFQAQPSVFEEGTNKNLLILICGMVILGLVLFLILK